MTAMSDSLFTHRWRAEWLLAAIAAFSFWSTAAVEVCSGTLLLLFLFVRGRGIARVIKPGPVLLWTMYFVGVVISILLSQYREQSYTYFNKLWHAALFLVALDNPWSEDRMSLPGWAFTVSAAAAAGASLVRSMGAGTAFADPFYQGLTTYSSLLALAGLVSLHRFLSGEITFSLKSTTDLLMYIIIACGVFFSVRFSASLVLILGSALIVLAARPKLVIHWVTCIALLLAISPDALRFKYLWIASGGQTDRYVLWFAGLDLLAHLPLFGFGPSSYWQIIPEAAKLGFTYAPPSSWHNDFLQVFFESGWMVGAVYLLLVGTVMVQGVRKVFRTTDRQERNLCVLATTLMGGMIIISASDAVISTAVLGVVWWLIVGGMLRLSNEKGKGNNE